MALLALWNPNIQFLKTDGTINAGGKLVVTDHNDAESIPANYSDADGTTLNASPIVLDALGRATCYIDDGSTYDLYVKDANGATLWTVTGMTPGSETIVVRAGFSLSSNDSSVSVVISVDQNGVTNYDLSIQKEIDRATEAEKGLADAIETEKTRAEGVESTLSKSIADETERAIKAEKASRTEIVEGDNITVEKTVGADGQDVYTVSGANIDVPVAGTASPLMDGKASVGNSLKYAREDHVHPTDTSREDKANKTTVVLGTSNSKYPTDKAVADFVNSSIATNTANYISNNGEPFTSVEQLEAYSGTVTNNDYAFVTGTDSEGNTYYDRYKATVSGSSVTWALEYRLNNSSFTAAQWSAINSGITSALVAKIHEHSNKDVLDGITSSDVASWNSKQDTLTAATTSEDGLMSAADKTKLNGIATGAEVNVQSDWDVTDSKSDAFIKNKPHFHKYIGGTKLKFKVCTVPKYLTSSTQACGIEVVYRIYDGAVHGELLHKVTNELYLERIGDISINVNTLKFYYIESSSSHVDIYADGGPYCSLTVAPLMNMPKDRVDFTGFGTVVSNLPEGATEITPLWVANSERSSGTAPVKVDAYGTLTAVPMDSIPTESSTNLMTSGDIKTAIDTVNEKGLTVKEISGEQVICFE